MLVDAETSGKHLRPFLFGGKMTRRASLSPSLKNVERCSALYLLTHPVFYACSSTFSKDTQKRIFQSKHHAETSGSFKNDQDYYSQV